MQHITNLAALDRELAGRVARFQAVTDTQFEPWHQPHFNVQHDSAPAPAEACSELLADKKADPVPWLTTRRFWAAYVALIGSALIGLHGWFAGWFA